MGGIPETEHDETSAALDEDNLPQAPAPSGPLNDTDRSHARLLAEITEGCVALAPDAPSTASNLIAGALGFERSREREHLQETDKVSLKHTNMDLYRRTSRSSGTY